MNFFSFFSLVITISLLPFQLYAGGTHAGGHSQDNTPHWQAPPGMAGRINPIEKTHESIQRGKELYKKNCALCHGPEARGDGPAAGALKQKPTDLASMAGKHQDGDFYWKIANGRGPMPGWKECG